ncbi:MAG: TPM domain-containing protein [Acidobacteria bacterium]|nr:TPM domain-containing protein [Acidobacteriota bacterium]
MRPLSAALFVMAAGYAADIGALQPQGYVSDFAGVVDSASREEIERYCAAVEKSTGAQLAFVTIASLDGEPVEDVANALLRKWGIGKKGENNGALLLLSVNDRRSRLEVGYGLEPYLPDGYSGSLLREMRPALRAGHYGEAFRVAAHQIGERIAQAKGVRIGGLQRRIAPEPEEFPWPLVVFAVIVVVILLTKGGAGPWWWMMGNMMGRGGWHGSSRGGFGGYDSGGGFGGFGGGDSGGGGASSDW